MSNPATRHGSWQERLPLVLAALVLAGGLVMVIGSVLQRGSAGEDGSREIRAKSSDAAPMRPEDPPIQPSTESPADDAELRRVLGQAKMHLAGNDLAAARASIEKAAELNSDFWEVHMLRGIVAAKADKHEDALEHYDRAEHQAPREPTLAQSRGVSLRRLGRVKEAHALFTQIIGWDPSFADAHLQRGLIDAGRGQYSEAADDFTRYIELRPDSPIGYRNRAAALAQLGKESESRLDQMKARELQALEVER